MSDRRRRSRRCRPSSGSDRTRPHRLIFPTAPSRPGAGRDRSSDRVATWPSGPPLGWRRIVGSAKDTSLPRSQTGSATLPAARPPIGGTSGRPHRLLNLLLNLEIRVGRGGRVREATERRGSAGESAGLLSWDEAGGAAGGAARGTRVASGRAKMAENSTLRG